MQSMKSAMLLPLCLLLFALAAAPAHGYDYHPLEIDSWWRYDDLYGGPST